jgi:Zn finger protein HypA/HybF involved in hydrogenase expression
MDAPDLYNKILCLDCREIYYLSGSTPLVKIICPKCGSKNYDTKTLLEEIRDSNKKIKE